jgi:hypothetical protein
MSRTDGLEWENLLVLHVVQALLGSVSPNMRAVSVEALPGRSARVHFALAQESEEDNEEIAEIVGELDALFGGDVRIDTEVWAGDRWWDSDWPGRDRRLVYAAKD